ncbi:MAG: pyruvate formate lyase family protein [Pseudomonadales bacterium]|nr:pyruvate formate lyase family protein [Pseudomonadales bacterium]MDP7594123.1 pyruvate formate lyase family protein [Pseudomonadales bacterium]HJN49428.1 pyruvate formate lyase family protein [Pseudomonadales bacterium]
MAVSTAEINSAAENRARGQDLSRVDEAIDMLRYKPVSSTTLERIRVTRRADERVSGLPQPLQLGEGLNYLLDHIAVPVSANDLLVGRIEEEVPDESGEALFTESCEMWQGRSIPPWMPDTGHECLAWDRLLKLGLPGLEECARRELQRRLDAGEQGDQLDYLRGAVLIYQAFRHYARRYATAAGAAGLEQSGAWCRQVADHPPATFAEAIQLMWLVGNVYCTMISYNPTLTFGRMDELLLPYYLKDRSDGRITPEAAGDLIEDFYCKNNLILGRGEHQMGLGSEKDTGWARNLSYDAPQYVVLAGRRHDGAAVANELTTLFLERIVPRFENPVVVLRYTDDLPADVWRLACQKMRANASMMVYSDRQIIAAMEHCGIDPEDAVTYTMHGCNWPDIPGKQRALYTGFIQLPWILRKLLLSPDHRISGIEELYAGFISAVREKLDKHADWFREVRTGWVAPGPLRVDDCFLEGPIEQARSWSVGGVKYPNIVLSITGLATVTDSIAAIDELVFKSGKVSMVTMVNLLQDDFADAERLRLLCVHAPKFGQGDERVDGHAVRLLESIHHELDATSRRGSADEVNIFRCLETDMRHIPFGKDLGATPDGRLAAQPISENTSPAPGSCSNGLTAMLGSLARLPFDRVNSGALNLRMQPRHFAGAEGLQRLSDLLRTYLELGGLQIQLSFASVQELRDAQVNPEQHRDLMIRITGYSAAFVDMTRKAQDEIIRREEMAG